MALKGVEKSKPLISVIIPSYNHAQFVTEAINSVASQDYRPLELIVIDDGSQDESVNVIEQCLKARLFNSQNLKVQFVQQGNSGAHNAINRGISLAQGEWITILNSDDYFLPKRLSKILKACRKQGSLLGMTQVVHVDTKGKKVPSNSSFVSWYRSSLEKKFATCGFHLLYNNIAVTTGNLFFHHSLIDKVGGFRSYQLMHDYDFLLRALAWTEPVWLREDLLAYRVHGNNTVLKVKHRSIYEAAELATEFLAQTVLFPIPPNSLAPWAPRWGQGMKRFLVENEESWLRGWIGPNHIEESLSHLSNAER